MCCIITLQLKQEYMKSIKTIVLAAIAMLAVSLPSAAQFRIGPRVGVDMNSFHMSKDDFKAENRAGFTGGLQMEFTVPVVNVGFDLSVMYVHRVSELKFKGQEMNLSRLKNRDYIDIPLNFKYKIGLPVIGKVFTPYLFTGPAFSFLTSKTAIEDAVKNKKFDVSWNFGVGIQLVQHLQLSASYGLGLTKTVETFSSYEGSKIDGKNNYWTVTAAWLF